MTERKRQNQFPGWCISCKNRVQKGAGLTWKGTSGKWLVEHCQGECSTSASRAPTTSRTTQKPKANTYGGDCANCGVYVKADQGRIVKVDGRWKAAHLDADACTAAATAKAEQQAQPQAERPARKTYAIPTGYYAVPSSRTDGQDFDFYHVNTPIEGKKWFTYNFVDAVIGGQGRVKISREQQKVALDTIEFATPELAGKAYAKAIGNCCKCNLLLTDDDSRTRGMGLKCYKKTLPKVQPIETPVQPEDSWRAVG